MRPPSVLLLLLGACQALPPAQDGSLRATQLRCEHLVEPLGIETRTPRLDWRLEAADPAARGLSQSAYQVLAVSEGAPLWDTGKVTSSATVDIEYAGPPLTSGQQVRWKVRVWDQDGKASAWSEVAAWSMGLLEPSDWQARWIGYDVPLQVKDDAAGFDGAQWIWFPGDDAQNAPAAERWFRGRFSVPEPAETARLIVSVDNHCEVFLNGQKVYENADELDGWRHGGDVEVAALLHPGDNVIAIAARNAAPSPAGVIAKLTVGAGGGWSFATDADWRCSDQVAEGWTSADFDERGWMAARIVAEHGGGPWGRIGQSGLFLPPPRFLRKEFRQDQDVKRATLYASALGLYQMYVNGERVGDDYFTPGWTDYTKRVYYNTYDVSDLLREGANTLGAVLADGWYAGYVGYGGQRNHYGRSPRLRAQLVIEHADGGRSVVATDASWQAAAGPLLEADFLMGETCDARRAITSWDPAQEFDGIQVACAPHPGYPVRAVAVLEPRTVTEVAPDTYVLDLGQNIAGVARIKVQGSPGQKITLRYAERLSPDGTLYTTNLRGARATDTYICQGGGAEEWEPRFTFHGFQYIEVSGLGRKPGPDTVVGVALSSDTPIAGSFETSNPLLNRLYSNTLWTQRANFIDVPTDCPQRDERLGWTGDAQAYIRTATFVADAQAFYDKWLVDLVDAQRADGQFPMVAPLKVAGDDGGPAWADAGVICPWAVYEVYGDRRLLARHYDSMARFLAFCEGRSVGLLPPAQFQCFGDWVAINADTPHDVIYTAYFAGCARLMARGAEELGRAEDARRYWNLYEGIKQAFNRAHVAADGRVKGDTQCAYVLALAFDLVDGERRAQAAAHLVERIRERGWHLSTGFVGTKDLMLVLEKIGRMDVAYRLLLNETFPSWGFTIRNGATSIWERWDGWTPEKGFQDPGMNSFAHYAFGAVTQWMFENIGGIRPAAPGFREIAIRPRPGGGLAWAKVGYDSIRGRIATEWRLDGDVLTLGVTIPPNTTATVFVPTTDAASVMESGVAAARARGVRFLRAEPDAAVFAVDSGTYTFSCPGPVVHAMVASGD
ncbi:MAG: rhamnosidase [Planctomycetota bacterium]|nr:MAG: rhamnosidase [Planctomycetota bacterium]